MRILLLALLLITESSFAATTWPVQLKFTQGTTVRTLPVPPPNAWGKAKLTYSETLTNTGLCQFNLGGQMVQFSPPCNTVTRDWVYPAPPPTCPPIPADVSRTMQCENTNPGTTGDWVQTHGWTQSLPPGCVNTPTPWLPTVAPSGECSAITPPPPSTTCVAGSGHDYQVGTGAGQLASGDLVPWENLAAGDSVRFFYKGSAYKTKFAINSHGTVANPVRVCGVTGPTGQLVDIDGSAATSRRTMNYGRASASSTNQARGVIWVGPKDTETDVNPPGAVVLGPGLYIHNAHPSKRFTDTNGAQQSYLEFGAAIVCDPCHDLTIVGNTIADSSQAVWTRSQDGGDARHSTNTIIRGNRFSGTGIAGDDHEHTLYIQSYTPTVEYNWFGPMLAGAGGNALKDRSVMPIVRYNKFESGAYALDFVEAEDYPNDATADPRYYTTFAYGNIIAKPGALAIHYGGNNGGTETYRKGHLYFWDNTLSLPGDPGEGVVYIFRISTLDETVDAWNNIFYCARGDDNYFCAFRTADDSSPGAGTLNLGVNWMTHGCDDSDPHAVCDSDPYHPPGGTLTGTQNLIVGIPAPFNASTFLPIGPALGAGQAQPATVSAYPVNQQIDVNAIPRARASTHDLGAVEH